MTPRNRWKRKSCPQISEEVALLLLWSHSPTSDLWQAFTFEQCMKTQRAGATEFEESHVEKVVNTASVGVGRKRVYDERYLQKRGVFIRLSKYNVLHLFLLIVKLWIVFSIEQGTGLSELILWFSTAQLEWLIQPEKSNIRISKTKQICIFEREDSAPKDG